MSRSPHPSVSVTVKKRGRAAEEDRRLAPLREALHAAAHLLPAQAPIALFVHHNTLHAYQHLPFHQALAEARATMDAEGYLSEDEYRAAYAAGRVGPDDLDAVLEEHLERHARGVDDEEGVVKPRELYRLALLHPLPVETEVGLSWRIEEQRALERMRPDVPREVRERFLERSGAWLRAVEAAGRRDDVVVRRPRGTSTEAWALSALWTACLEVSNPTDPHVPSTVELGRVPVERTYRDALRAVTGSDPATIVNPWLIRFCAAFLDLGMAEWPMPAREQGMLTCFRRLVTSATMPLPAALAKVRGQVAHQIERGLDAEGVVLEELQLLGVPPEHYARYLTRTLLSLAGWAGMIHRLETFPEEADPEIGPPSLVDYVAIRLVLDRVACEHVARVELGHRGPLRELRTDAGGLDRPDRPAHQQAAFRLFHLAQLTALTPEAVAELSPRAVRSTMDRLDDFDAITRRRIWQEAYDRWMRRRVADAVGVASRRPKRPVRPAPRAQVWFCIDDREESIRRHLEEQSDEIETVGVAGFFGIAIAYKGLDSRDTHDLCPVPVDPQHEVHEEPTAEHRTAYEKRAVRRRWLGQLQRLSERGTRGLFRSTLLTPALGLLSTLPLLMRVLFPRLSHRLTQNASRALLPKPRTQLTGLREDDAHVRGESARPRGFTLDEAADRLAATFENCGQVDRFPPIVLVVGHGSTSANNPHAAAYDCGACAGNHGGPNARLFAELANSPAIRERLAAHEIHIPDSTWFVGGFHDTCSDAVDLYDVEGIPEAVRDDFEWLRERLEVARARDAQERCRKLESAPLDPSPASALRHVEARAVDLGEARPELGHATNCVSIVGRRETTRGLFLDRRAFLTSYDPTIDLDGEILQRVMSAVGPVCAGINLEYYFSRVDNDRFGCGTKLPHNLSGLLGVMDGHQSDLRTGLPKQMIEIHEPVRLVSVIEASPETMDRLCARVPEVNELITNAWMQVVLLHPETGEVYEHRPGRGYVPIEIDPHTVARAASSHDHYRGRSESLPFALIGEADRELIEEEVRHEHAS